MFFKRNDLTVGLIFLLSGICIYLEALKIRKISLASKMVVQDVTGPAGFTVILSIIMIVVGLLYFTGALFCKKERSRTSKINMFSALLENVRQNRKSYILVLISLLYVIVLPFMGYIVTTVIYMLLMLHQLEYKKTISSAIISSGFALFMFLVFSKLLKVSLPTIFNNFWI